MENQSGKKLKCLCTDNGGEYVSKAFQDFCESKGINRELTAPDNPSQNGVAAESTNRTIQEKVRSMLSNAALPNGFWAEAVAIAVHLINRSPSKVLDKEVVAEMVWSGKPPSYKHRRVFGCELTAMFQRSLGISESQRVGNAYFLAMVNLERWVTGFGIQSPERLSVAMMCISMKPSFMQN